MPNTWQIKNTQLSTSLHFEASGSSVLQLHEWQQFLLGYNSNMSLLPTWEQKLALDEAFSGGTIGTVATEAWVEANFMPLGAAVGGGLVTLSRGIGTVFTPLAANGMKVLLTPQDLDCLGTVRLDPNSIVPGVSFQVNSTGVTDDGVVFWELGLAPIASGLATMAGGMVTVNTPLAYTGMKVLLTCQDLNTLGTPRLDPSTVVAGVSFGINSTGATDTGVVYWQIF